MAEKQIDKISGKRVINESGFTHGGDYMVFHDDDFKYRGNDDETLGLRDLSLYQDGYAPGVTIRTKNQYMDDMGNKRRYFQDEEPDKFIYPNRKEHDTESPYYGQRRYSLDLNDDPNDNGEDSHTRKGAWYALRERQQKFQNLLKQASAELRSAGEKNVFPSEKIFAFYCNLLYYITSAKYDIVRRLSMHPKYLEATICKIYMATHGQNRKDQNLQSPFLREWFRGLLDAGYESLDKLADECMGVSDKFEKAFENLENEWRGMRRGLSYFSRRSKKAASAEERLKNLVWDIEAIRSMMDAPVTAANHQGDNPQKGENPNPKLGVFADNEFSTRQAGYNQTRNTLYGDASVSNSMMHESKTNKNIKNTIKLKESDLRNIVKNAVVNVLNESVMDEWFLSGYEPDGPCRDGKYTYYGTGSDASKKRGYGVEKPMHGSSFFDDNGKEGSSPYDRHRKEYGRMEIGPDIGNRGRNIYSNIRDFAGGRLDVNEFKRVRLTEKQLDRIAALLGRQGGRRKVTVLWLDDKRNPGKYLSNSPQKPSSAWDRNNRFYSPWLEVNFPQFVWVRTFQEFTAYILKNGVPDFVSFDHDLGTVENGIDCARWLNDYCRENGIPMPECYVHSANEKRRGGFDEFLKEDAYVKNADSKSKKLNLTYHEGGPRNQDGVKKYDLLRTGRMERLDANTYEVPLKGGLTSYNITDIEGSVVMHYFKNYFKFQKQYVDLKDVRKNKTIPYEMEMKKNEFDDFMQKFIRKVNFIIKYVTEKESDGNGGQLDYSIYPVPSSSNFNAKMAEELKKKFPGMQIIDQGLFEKNLANIEKDRDFLDNNKDYYSKGFFVRGTSDDRTGEEVVDDEHARLSAVVKAQSYIGELSSLAEKLIGLWHQRKSYASRNTYDKRITELYADYYNTYARLISASSYSTKRGGRHDVQLAKVARLIKYSKPKRVEIRSKDIWETVSPYLGGQNSEAGLPYRQIGIGIWEPVPYQIKNSYDPVRMGMKGYFTPNQEILAKEAEKLANTVLVVFDDNISGGATLSDICNQAKRFGVKTIIPITFGKMDKKFSGGRGSIEVRTPDGSTRSNPQFNTNFTYTD